MASMHPARERSLVPDQDGRGFDLTMRALAAVAASFGVVDLVLGLLLGRTGVLFVGAVALTSGLWLALEAWRQGPSGRMRVMARMTIVLVTVAVAASAFQPEVAGAAAISTLIPVIVAIPYVGSRQLASIMVVVGSAGVTGVILGRLGQPSDDSLIGLALSVPGFIGGYLAVLLFLWVVSRQLRSAADDLRNVVAMTADLARTLDPNLVGDQIALHVARAVGAEECGLNYLDRDGTTLLVHGYYPTARRSEIEPIYSLVDYPATSDVIRSQLPVLIDVDDPDADSAEVAFLREIDHRSMAIVPLVAAGRTIGVIEFSSRQSSAFDERRLRLAAMLASEAAMTLENARLYDDIRHQAFHDGLTGLANRALFRDQVQRAMDGTTGRIATRHAVLFIDIDDFKTLNDRLGHARGDEVLSEAAARVRACLRPGDTAARLGGDEFGILLEDVPDETVAVQVAERLSAAFQEYIILDGAIATIAASIGIAVTGEGDGVEDVLRNADVAMYAAKARGRNRWALYGPELREETAARGELAVLLQGVVARDELRLDFQPIVDMSSGAVVSLEALVRWQPANRPLLMPADFIPLAEETGAIVPIGRWVLREACRRVRDWQVRLDLPELEACVNLSVRQFEQPEFMTTVHGALADSGLPPTSLTLEITESLLMSDTSEAVARLDELRALGVRLAIDDFGTGYSSLSYLERFPVNVLKIDRAFVERLAGDEDRPVLARAIIELGRALALDVVAEGIEREEQADRLRELGCRLGQGYLFARPLGPEATEGYLARSPDLAHLRRRPALGRIRRERRRRLRLVSNA